MSTREDHLKCLNELIEEEHGIELTETDKLVDSGMDSFGTTMVLLALDQRFDKKFDANWTKSVNIDELTVKDILDRI